ncbi:Reticuline oxidase [Parachaetomium inaequale]|uniref:Reticuline oxidase n=1 Tax=Parachaetomium inaequale TaxID=2588326 RepID=A0AAN6SP81_9PEZI|nr:Reticuline oxidase [Parachaetomium inaequale]
MHISPFLLVASLGLGAFGKTKTAGACSNAALERCLTAKGVPFKVPCDPDWGAYNRTHNIRLPVTPAAIVLPQNTRHISTAVICAGKSGVKVQAKSGGHSYGSYGYGGIDGQVSIDLRHFNKTVMASDGSNIAVVGGGVHLGPMASAVYAQGKRAVSHGVCPSVGVGGHATHGGWGYSSRAWGLTLDHIVELRVVLANGAVARASAEANSDLFWALRGAADSIGIVTSFSLRTNPAPEEVINFTYEFQTLAESVEQATSAFLRLQAFISNTTAVDRRLSFTLATMVTPRAGSISRTILIQGIFMGTLAEYTSQIEPEMLRGLPGPTNRSVLSHDWPSSLAALSPDGTLEPTPMYSDFFANSVTVDSPGMSEAALRSYLAYMLEGPAPPVPYTSSMDLWGGADTQINLRGKKTDAGFAAFPHRNVFWALHNIAQMKTADVPFPDEGIAYLNGLRDAITRGLSVGQWAAYQNLLDTSLTREEAHELYYGDAVLGRLQAIKAVYDPGNVFSNPQSV